MRAEVDILLAPLHGNVEWLAQVQDKLGSKGVRYAYDLLSNKVTQVSYQQGEADQFFHRYGYDGDNRLTQVQTSSDGVIWEQDARYRYFAHGPLRRLELGEDHVQGLDYTYTLQGWLKGINHPGQDPGQDGSAATRTGTAKDAFGMSLAYFTGDYATDNAAWVSGASSVLQPQRSLYNGNIAAWTTKTRYDLPNAPALSAEAKKYLQNPVGEHYRYDQLNRLLGSELSYKPATASAFTSTTDYATAYRYDPNGNLQSLTRNGASSIGQLAMDQLTYGYDTGSGHDNRLLYVKDETPDLAAYESIPHNESTATQYGYDAIGNLTSDASSGVTAIQWNVYGKIERVTRNDGSSTVFAYDAQGNRVRKTRATSNGGLLEHTYYVRDAQGNVLAVYEQQQEQAGQAATAIRLLEQPLYGSSRLGMRKLVAGSAPAAGAAGYYARVTQQKQYELVDHLGNVRALVSDTKRVDTEVAGSYKPDLLAYFNYYPFGMLQPGRSAPSTTTGSGGYRYGFNGKEKDNNGELGLTNYDYGFRIYNPGLAKFLSVDPLTGNYPWYTPYQFAGNMPISAIDLDGLEEVQVFASEIGRIHQPLIRPSQWLASDRSGASGTFASAAKYNTHYLNSEVYKPVDQIHKFYIWASKEIDKGKSNIKFFHAAAAVTGLTGVGGAYHYGRFDTKEAFGIDLFSIDVFSTKEVNKSLAGVNAMLLRVNMPIIRDIIENGYSSAVYGSGKEFSLNYVKYEQGNVTTYLNAHPLSNDAADVINQNLEDFEFMHPEYTVAKGMLGIDRLDFRKENHRVAIGQATVNRLYDSNYGQEYIDVAKAKSATKQALEDAKSGRYD